MSGDTQLNWSILGLGRFGRIHARTLQTIRGVRLHSACNRNADVLQQHAAELQLPKISTTADDILADSEVDVVSIVTHWQDHYPLAMEALSAGKHVFLEKPMAATTAQAQEILKASRQSEGKLMVGHICRFDPRYSLARERILAGEIGEVTSIHAKRNLPVAPANIRLGKIPPLVGDGIHDLDLAMWMLGRKPNSVFARNIKIHDFTYPDAGWARFDLVILPIQVRPSLSSRRTGAFPRQPKQSLMHAWRSSELLGRLASTAGKQDYISRQNTPAIWIHPTGLQSKRGLLVYYAANWNILLAALNRGLNHHWLLPRRPVTL